MFIIFLVAVAVSWVISPLSMIGIAKLYEGRALPLRPSRQFAAFFPGDLFLGVAVGGFVTVAVATYRAQDTGKLNYLLLAISVILAFVIGTVVAYYFDEFERKQSKLGTPGSYSQEAMESPTKAYHNLLVFALLTFAVAYSVLYITLAVCFSSLSWRDPWLLAGNYAWCVVVGLLLYAVCFVVDFMMPLRYPKGRQRDAFLNARSYSAHPGVVVQRSSWADDVVRNKSAGA